jgi:20S proteasome subunit alpha 4
MNNGWIFHVCLDALQLQLDTVLALQHNIYNTMAYSLSSNPCLRSHWIRVAVIIAVLVVFYTTCDNRVQAAHSRKRVVAPRRSVDPSSRYDRSLTRFDPSGRLLQVEYGLEAARRGSSVVAWKCRRHCSWCETFTQEDASTHSDVIIVVVVVVVIHKLMSSSLPATAPPSSSMLLTPKIHRLNDHLWMSSSGLAGDAQVLASHLRSAAYNHRLSYGEGMQVTELAHEAAYVQHRLTYQGGIRPLGCSALLWGHDMMIDDDESSPRIFRVDPGGVCEDCNFAAIGQEREAIMNRFIDQHGSLLQIESTSDPVEGIQAILESIQASLDADSIVADVWIFEPNVQRRGQTHATCFQNVQSDNLSPLSDYFTNTEE